MTVCAFTAAVSDGNERNERADRPGCVISANGSYAARLARDGECWYPERWTLDSPEPYAVPLPGNQPEDPGTEVQPMADGRVLIHRVADGRHVFSLLYPTGPGTGELPLGAVECPREEILLRLLPPAPTGDRAYALAVGRESTAVWLVAGGAQGPELLAKVPGRCSGGVWLDRAGRMLALDRTPDEGPTKTVVVDLGRGGEVSPLLQITDGSDDRLLLADPDSGLLLIRSDAPSPGRKRLGWGVLGSARPVRFPSCLSLEDPVTPFAVQPGQALTPESCAVALRIDGATGSWIGLWRPADRRVHQLAAPEGWLAGAGLWTREGALRLPYATGAVRCGMARVEMPEGPGPRPAAGPGARPASAEQGATGPEQAPEARPLPEARPHEATRPVTLQQALLPRRAQPQPTPLLWVRTRQMPVAGRGGIRGDGEGRGDGRGTVPPVPGTAVVGAG
ncbi:hypothetical protein [Streptomyces nodosus]|uniref:hypothetical protein n=1 Tax=Streptomyces nodosus TaxID=40318 RepID=UPI00180A5FBE|nr:hypothetical protein [Streptomyces nodosus]MBB4791505.1 hypothetical protein [Streptomyces nodosus]